MMNRYKDSTTVRSMSWPGYAEQTARLQEWWMNVTMWQLVSSGGLQAPSALSIVEPRPVDSPICVALEPADKIGAGYTVSETWRPLFLLHHFSSTKKAWGMWDYRTVCSRVTTRTFATFHRFSLNLVWTLCRRTPIHNTVLLVSWNQ